MKKRIVLTKIDELIEKLQVNDISEVCIHCSTDVFKSILDLVALTRYDQKILELDNFELITKYGPIKVFSKKDIQKGFLYLLPSQTEKKEDYEKKNC